jgi:hypothetical protein
MSEQQTLLFKSDLILKALEDAGYKSAAYGLAELIDNSIQAGANEINVYMFSEMVKVAANHSEQIVKVAVLDNGKGMDSEILEKSIGFGSGERLGARKGLGKFGMGLPASSISFAAETKIYSWQDGIQNALMTTLSKRKVAQGEMYCPKPVRAELPTDVLAKASSILGRHGTLVVWEEVSLTPKRFAGLSSQVALTIGRIYRKFLHEGKISIEIHDINNNSTRNTLEVKPNDPSFLMAPSATPAPFENEPMFVEYPDMVNPVRTIEFRSNKLDTKDELISGQVRVKVSYVKPGIRPNYYAENNRQDAGNSKFGQFARQNVGYSICREGRELMLEDKFAKPSDPTERWWGVEIDFDASLDELFGVTTNKQYAQAVPPFAHWNWKNEALEGETEHEFLIRSQEEGDVRHPLMILFRDIDKAVASVRLILNQDKAKRKGGDDLIHTPPPGPEAVATEVAAEREKEGKTGEAFNDELPTEEEVSKILEDEGIIGDAKDHVVEVVRAGHRYAIEVGHNEDSPAFFLVRRKRGMLIIVINSYHPFYKSVYQKLFFDADGNDLSAVGDERLAAAQDAFKLVLIAWARMEDEKSDAEDLREARTDWGRILKQFLRRAEPAQVE